MVRLREYYWWLWPLPVGSCGCVETHSWRFESARLALVEDESTTVNDKPVGIVKLNGHTIYGGNAARTEYSELFAFLQRWLDSNTAAVTAGANADDAGDGDDDVDAQAIPIAEPVALGVARV